MKKGLLIVVLSMFAVSAFGQAREIIKCRIWKPKSFCEIPSTVNIPENAKFSVGVSVTNMQCSELDKMKNVAAIWITVREKNVNELRLKDNYSNIRLIRKENGDTLQPIAYMSRSKPVGKSEGNPQYLSSKSTFGGECVYELKPRERYDLFIVFPTVEAGDRLIIDDFFEADVK